MVHFCCLCKATHGQYPGVSFHSIPSNENRKKHWSNVVNKKFQKTSRICSKHFLPTDFRYKVTNNNMIVKSLLPTAVPSVSIINRVNANTSDLDVTVTKNCDTTLDTSEASQCHDKTIRIVPLARLYNQCEHEKDSDCEVNQDLNSDCNKNKKLNVGTNEIIYYVRNSLSENQCHNVSESSSEQNSDDNTETIVIESSHKRLNDAEEESGSRIKRVKTKRYVGDLSHEDFTNNEAYEIVQKLYTDYRRKTKAYNQTIYRLQKKLTNLTELFDYLKETGVITKEVVDRIKVNLS